MILEGTYKIFFRFPPTERQLEKFPEQFLGDKNYRTSFPKNVDKFPLVWNSFSKLAIELYYLKRKYPREFFNTERYYINPCIKRVLKHHGGRIQNVVTSPTKRVVDIEIKELGERKIKYMVHWYDSVNVKVAPPPNPNGWNIVDWKERSG